MASHTDWAAPRVRRLGGGGRRSRSPKPSKHRRQAEDQDVGRLGPRWMQQVALVTVHRSNALRHRDDRGGGDRSGPPTRLVLAATRPLPLFLCAPSAA